MAIKKTTEQFKQEVFSKNKNLEILDEYINNNTKIKVRCKKHDYTWDVIPRQLLSKPQCPICSGHNKNNKEFLKEVNQANKDIIPLTEYTRDRIPMDFLCLRCGKKFTQTPAIFLNTPSCPICRNRKRRNQDDFIKEMEETNEDITIIGTYTNFQNKVKCKCKKCSSEWEAFPQNLLRGHGCPICNSSIGERKVRQFLEKYKIKFSQEYIFKDCKDIFCLPFDFFLFDQNMCIEFDGIQHFEPVQHYGGAEYFEIVKKHDDIKNRYCTDNNIALLRISYKNINNIEEILKEKLLV